MKSRTAIATAAGAGGGVLGGQLFKLPFDPVRLLEFGQVGLAALMTLLGFYLYWVATHATEGEVDRKAKAALQFLTVGLILFVICVLAEIAKTDLNSFVRLVPFGIALVMLAAGFFLYYKQNPRALQFMLVAGCAFLLGLLAIKILPRAPMAFIELPPLSDKNHQKYGAIMIEASEYGRKIRSPEKATETRSFPVNERLDLKVNIESLTEIVDKYLQQSVPPPQQAKNSVPDLTPSPR
jgi:hypothetical protein